MKYLLYEETNVYLRSTERNTLCSLSNVKESSYLLFFTFQEGIHKKKCYAKYNKLLVKQCFKVHCWRILHSECVVRSFFPRANALLGNVFLKKKRKQRINIAQCVFVECFTVFVCLCAVH